MFSLCFSREFTFKLEGFLVMDYSHMYIYFKNRIFTIINEPIVGFLIEKLSQVNMINEQDLLKNDVEMELDFVDLVSDLMIN